MNRQNSCETASRAPRLASYGWLGRRVVLTFFLLGVGWFYHWMPETYHQRWLETKPEGIYNELSAAFLAGQTYLKIVPDPRLVALPDPYDPIQNAPYRVNDLSLFGGRYYAYMGPAPALVLFMPVRLLTGQYLRQETAAPLLNLLGAGASVALVLRLRRCFLPDSPASILVFAILALVLADGYYAANRGAIAQQVAVAGAYGFAMLALWACGNAAISTRHSGRWLALAGFAFGLAIASRPNYVFASAALLPPLFYGRRSDGGRRAVDTWKTAFSAAAPLGIVVALLLSYNRIRFGHIFDFGQRYVLGAWNQISMPNSGLGYGWENAWHYLLAPALYSTCFPFVIAPSWIAVSILRHVPWLWLAPIAAWALSRRTIPGPVRAIGLSSLILAAANLISLIFLPSGNPSSILTSANARYLLDFQPGFTLFVALGIVAAFQPSIMVKSIGRWIVLPLAGVLLAISIVIAFSLDIGAFPSETYRPLAFFLDIPTYLLGLARGVSYGPIATDVSFPFGKTGSFEPILSTGSAESGDLLYVNYVSPTRIRFGLIGTGLKGPESGPIAVTYGPSHHLLVSLGSLFPPDGHPLLSSLDGAQIAYLKRNLRVELDGRIVVDSPAYFHSASPNQVLLGENPFFRGYCSAAFSGVIRSSQRLPIAAPQASLLKHAAYGAVRMRLLLPLARVQDAREPLLVTGVTGAGDFVYVQYLGENLIRLGVDHWGSVGIRTEPFRVDFGVEHTIEIAMGALFPAMTEDSRREHVRLLFDGTKVLESTQDTYDSSPYDVTIGTNAIGGSTCDYAFTGRILETERIPVGP